jgi:DNA-binding PadR family transcriptional regulator
MGEPPDAEDPAGATPPLNAAGRVILGMIGLGKATGYDIKQLVDKSTRHFWAASYGQIYPELRRLEGQGLLHSRSEPAGGRQRTVYELTEAGRAALDQWLRAGAGLVWELRDEGMLKLFFSDLIEPERRLAVLSQMRSALERKRDQLVELDRSLSEPASGPRMTLEFGLGMTRWMLDWCEQAERRLTPEPPD